MVRKLAVLFLLMALLPACAAMPPPFPPERPAPQVRETDAALFQTAEASYRRQAYRQAYQQYANYLERYPQGDRAMDARLQEAEISGLLGDWQGSLRRYQGILARQPQPETGLKARYGLGRAYFKLREYQQAIQVLDSLTAATDLPRSLWFSTQALMVEIALKQGQVPQAFARLRLAAQDLASGDPEWFEDLKTRLLEQATVPELEQLAALYRDNPLSAALLLRLARLSQDAGQSEEARKWVATLKERFPNSPEAAGAQRLLTGGKVVVGCLLPLSGHLSNLGFRVQRGMELAAKGASVKLVFRDIGTDPETAAAVTRELAQDESVLAILGPLSSAMAQSAANVAQAAAVPLIALSQKDGLTQTGNWIFQAFLTPRQQVRALVRQGLSMGIKRFAILNPDSSYGRTFSQNFQEEVAAVGGELAAQVFYSPGSQEFGPTLSALAESLKPQAEGAPMATALFIPDDAAAVAAIAGGLAGTPLKGIQLLGTNLLHSARVPAAQLTALQGVIFPDAFYAGDPNPEVQKFIAAYRQQYGEEPDYLAAQGYTVFRVMARAAESPQALTRMALPQQLLTLSGVPGLPWFLKFNAQREEESSLYLLTITGGSVQMAPPPSGGEPRQ
ncbi:MAG: penicillin-binding protein activator [Desulfobacterales bacterium]|nr:penicillin-binding protein activator [Pseudomonadota bacterium]MCG2772123.1 penicillin-binding protein activator [Desulfobacterales bacterium]